MRMHGYQTITVMAKSNSTLRVTKNYTIRLLLATSWCQKNQGRSYQTEQIAFLQYFCKQTVWWHLSCGMALDLSSRLPNIQSHSSKLLHTSSQTSLKKTSLKNLCRGCFKVSPVPGHTEVPAKGFIMYFAVFATCNWALYLIWFLWKLHFSCPICASFYTIGTLEKDAGMGLCIFTCILLACHP